MSQTLIEFINNQLSQAPGLLLSYTKDTSGNTFVKRELFYSVLGRFNKFKAGEREIKTVAISGLRGVGKTTLLAQLFTHVYKQNPQDVFYISVDQLVNVLGFSLAQVLEGYQQVLGQRFSALTSPKYIFIDEIHYDTNWPSVLKMVFDSAPNVFVVVTGSSALSLQTTADLARRLYIEKLMPLSFLEYRQLKTGLPPQSPQLSDKLKDTLFFSKDAGEVYSRLLELEDDITRSWFGVDALEIDLYLKHGSMPYATRLTNDIEAGTLTLQIVDRLVEKDLSGYKNFDVSTIKSVKNIILLMASSLEVSVTKMAESLAGISTNTIVDVLDALEKAEFFIRVYPYGSVYKKVRKPSKYYFSSPAVRHAMLTIVEGQNAYIRNKGSYLEDACALALTKAFRTALNLPLFYHSAKGGADFIADFVNRKVVLELGFGSNKDERQANFTLNEVGGAYGLVVCDSKTELIERVVKVPLKTFLLL